MSVFIIEFKNNNIGIHNTFESATDYVYSLYNSKFIDDFDKVFIQEFKINTNIILNRYNLNLKYEITKKINTNYIGEITELNDDNCCSFIPVPYAGEIELDEDVIELDEEDVIELDEEVISIGSAEKEIIKQNNKDYAKKQNILGQHKIDVVHELNLLKEKQKLLNESKKKYESDLKLYYNFKDIKLKSANFDIPFMFEEKYNTFEYLEVHDILDYEHFIKKYKPSKLKTTYDDLFEIKEPLSDSDSDSETDEPFTNEDTPQLLIATNQFLEI